MRKADKKDKIIELDKTCINCNYFFSYPLHVSTEYGICLNDNVFDPYVDEMLENENFDLCKDLVEEKKFDGNIDCCDKFEMVEFFDPESSPNLTDNNEMIDISKFSDIIDIISKNKSIEEYKERLKSKSLNTKLKVFNDLAFLSTSGNKKASKYIVTAFKEIPPPVTLEEAHFKIDVLQILNISDDVDEIINILIRDLYETKSNNHTRQWISKIFNYLNLHKKKKFVRDQLYKMLSEKQFSYRIKNKINDILNEEDYFFM